MYDAREDSLFLVKITKKYLKDKNNEIKILDIGTGSGIQTKNLIELGIKKQNIIVSDIDDKALKIVENLGVKTINSNLFESFKSKEKFDLIIFNPPYLPENKYDTEIDTTGGKKGDEVIIRFIEQLKSHLTKKGVCLLLTSSITPKKWITLAEKNKFIVKKIETKKLFFEELHVWELSLI